MELQAVVAANFKSKKLIILPDSSTKIALIKTLSYNS